MVPTLRFCLVALALSACHSSCAGDEQQPSTSPEPAATETSAAESPSAGNARGLRPRIQINPAIMAPPPRASAPSD